jgi:hypothetical protein
VNVCGNAVTHSAILRGYSAGLGAWSGISVQNLAV